MLRVTLLAALFGLISVVSGCMTSGPIEENPAYQTWTGPYQGVPAFDKIKASDFEAALDAMIENTLKELNAIAEQKAEPTFANTMVPMEQTEISSMRVAILFNIWSSNLSDKTVQDLEKTFAPKFAELNSKVMQNEKLFKRVETLYKNMKSLKLNKEQRRLVSETYTGLKKSGAALSKEQKAKVANINKRHAELTTQFGQNLLADEENEFLHIKSKEGMKGLPKAFVEAAATEAKKRGVEGYALSNTRSSLQPFMTLSPNRELRKKAFMLFTSRGDNGNKSDNNKIITEILKLRAERSKIMGFKSYAHWQLSDKMAKTPEATMSLMKKVWKPAIKQVKKDVAAMQKIANKEGAKFKIAPWDYRYYAEKLRKARYDFDMDKVKPYLQLPNIQKAMFWMAGELYGFRFKQVNNVPVFHPDVTVFEVSRKGKTVGLWYFDPYARKGKRSGAWMNAYRVQNRLKGKDIFPIVSNNSNFVKAKKGEVTTISWDDAETMFHEFGHALHGLSSDVTYPSLAGTNTARDFVEFPSQIHEDWLSTPEVMKFLKNKEGKILPKKYVRKLKKAATFNEGFATTEYLASALVDMKIHLSTQKNIDPKAFEKKTLTELGLPSEIVMRHRLPQFAHIFTGEGYSAGYYSYLWADVLRQDAFKAFLEAKGPYDKKVAKRFHKNILSVGNTIDPGKAFRNFRGRDPKVEALLEAKGFSKTR